MATEMEWHKDDARSHTPGHLSLDLKPGTFGSFKPASDTQFIAFSVAPFVIDTEFRAGEKFLTKL